MFNEVSYSGLGDAAGDLFRSLGWPTRAAWKAAGRPKTRYPGSTVGINPVPPVTDGNQVPIDSVNTSPTGTVTPKVGGGGFFDSIPTTYLLIGGAVLALMVLKK